MRQLCQLSLRRGPFSYHLLPCTLRTKEKRTLHLYVLLQYYATLRTGSCWSSCNRYDDVRFLSPIRLRKTCSRQIRSSPYCHLPILCYCAHVGAECLCCPEIRLLTVRSVTTATSDRPSAIRVTDTVSLLSFMATWFGSQIKENCNK